MKSSLVLNINFTHSRHLQLKIDIILTLTHPIINSVFKSHFFISFGQKLPYTFVGFRPRPWQFNWGNTRNNKRKKL